MIIFSDLYCPNKALKERKTSTTALNISLIMLCHFTYIFMNCGEQILPLAMAMLMPLLFLLLFTWIVVIWIVYTHYS